MTFLHQQTLAYARLHPVPHTGEESWDQLCGNLMYRIGEHIVADWAPSVTGPTAWDVAVASGTLNPNHAAAPAGAFHWWRNRGGDGTPGHVGLDTTGGGLTVFMATYAVQHPVGEALGYQSVAGYSSAKPFMEYVGWTPTYAGAEVPTPPPAAEEPQVSSHPDLLGDSMPIIAIEQNLSPDHPSYLTIGIGGIGRGWIEIPPNKRDYYDVLRGVLCHYARVISPDALDVLPRIPAGVDVTGWSVTANAFTAGLDSHELV